MEDGRAALAFRGRGGCDKPVPVGADLSIRRMALDPARMGGDLGLAPVSARHMGRRAMGAQSDPRGGRTKLNPLTINRRN